MIKIIGLTGFIISFLSAIYGITMNIFGDRSEFKNKIAISSILVGMFIVFCSALAFNLL